MEEERREDAEKGGMKRGRGEGGREKRKREKKNHFRVSELLPCFID